MTLEICAFNIQSAFIAYHSGADRIELCAEPGQGGTTPSLGTVKYAIEHIPIAIFPMVRPRGGNFIYDRHELAIMKEDILTFREAGCPGIATGILLPDGKIDTDNLKRFVEWAHPMSVTCHKAFDGCPSALEALEDVINTGCSRILTSGLAKTATEGADVLRRLIEAAAGRIIIMPGGSVRSSNIAALAAATGATEFHSSALVARATNHIADEEEIKQLKFALEKRN